MTRRNGVTVRGFTWHAEKVDELKELLEDIVVSAHAGQPPNPEDRSRWNQSWTGQVLTAIEEWLPKIADAKVVWKK